MVHMIWTIWYGPYGTILILFMTALRSPWRKKSLMNSHYCKLPLLKLIVQRNCILRILIWRIRNAIYLYFKMNSASFLSFYFTMQFSLSHRVRALILLTIFESNINLKIVLCYFRTFGYQNIFHIHKAHYKIVCFILW